MTAVVSSLSIDSSFIGGATTEGTVTLTMAAPEGGTVVELGSNHPALSVPASVTVPSGSDRATFTVTTMVVTATANVTVTARTGQTTVTSRVLLRIHPGRIPSPAGEETVTFGSLQTNGASVRVHDEAGFRVEVEVGEWIAITGRGNPAPSIQVFTASQPIGELLIRKVNGEPFWFTSVDLSGTTAIPLQVNGYLSGQPVFAYSDQLSSGSGGFVTSSNGSEDAAIDLLVIKLTNPTGGANPMGVDTIRLRR